MSDNVFDLTNIDDVPNLLAWKKSLRGEIVNLLELFKKKEVLSIDEIIVGLFRVYNEQRTRTWVSATLHVLKKKKIVEGAEGRGKYKLCA